MTSVPDEARQAQCFHRDPDGSDPIEYALRVVIPYWAGGLEDRCRFALARAGFEVSNLFVNTYGSQAAFSARRAQHAPPVTVEEARAALRQSLIGAGCRFLDGDLSLAVDDGCWKGVFAPTPLEDQFDPMDWIALLPPRAEE